HSRDRLADLSAWAQVFDLWGRTTRRTWLTTYQPRSLQARRAVWRRPRPPVPLLQLLVQDDELVDFADPGTGISGLRPDPDAERVLTVWADDLLTGHHGTDGVYVIAPGKPVTRSWLDLLVAPESGTRPAFAVVTASTA